MVFEKLREVFQPATRAGNAPPSSPSPASDVTEAEEDWHTRDGPADEGREVLRPASQDMYLGAAEFGLRMLGLHPGFCFLVLAGDKSAAEAMSGPA